MKLEASWEVKFTIIVIYVSRICAMNRAFKIKYLFASWHFLLVAQLVIQIAGC